jgi:predicted CopG family antitoxin
MPAAELVAIAARAVLCLCAQTQDMGTKTIGLREEVYERLKSHKREDESFTELVNRLLDETATDWREGFGTLPEQDARELEAIVADSRARTSEGLSGRQQKALGEFVDSETEDETA